MITLSGQSEEISVKSSAPVVINFNYVDVSQTTGAVLEQKTIEHIGSNGLVIAGSSTATRNVHGMTYRSRDNLPVAISFLKDTVSFYDSLTRSNDLVIGPGAVNPGEGGGGGVSIETVNQMIADVEAQFTLGIMTSAALTALRNNIIATPSLAPLVGTRVVVSDGILANRTVIWNGDSYTPDDGIVAALAALPPATVATRTSNNTTDTTTTVIHTVVIPGFLMGKNSKLTIVPVFSCDNVNANSRNLIVQYFTTAEGGSTIIAPQVTGTTLSARYLAEIQNCNAYNAQIAINNNSYGGSGSALFTFNKNLVNDFEVRFACSWTAQQTPTTATISLNGYNISVS